MRQNFIKKSILMLGLIPTLALAQEGQSTLKFNFEGKKPSGKVYIKYNLYGPNLVDSLIIDKPTAEFSINVNQPTQVTIAYSKDTNVTKKTVLSDERTIYVEKGTANISINDSIKTAPITGMPINDKYENLRKFYLKKSEKSTMLCLQSKKAILHLQNQFLQSKMKLTFLERI
jgi:hypothetical protein